MSKIVVLIMVGASVAILNNAFAVTLRTNFDKLGHEYCKTGLDFSYTYCINAVADCVSHMNSIKKSYMTEEERANLIITQCIVDSGYRYLEPSYEVGPAMDVKND